NRFGTLAQDAFSGEVPDVVEDGEAYSPADDGREDSDRDAEGLRDCPQVRETHGGIIINGADDADNEGGNERVEGDATQHEEQEGGGGFAKLAGPPEAKDA